MVNADPRLNKILLKVCDETLTAPKSNGGAFRVTVENTIALLLPHGQAQANIVAKKLGMSERTLARRLAEEGVTFIEVLQQLKASLASRYLGTRACRFRGSLGFSVLRRRALSVTPAGGGQASLRESYGALIQQQREVRCEF